MAGRNTSKELHPTKVGHMVQDVSMTEEDWQSLEGIANYQFSPAQRETVVRELTVCRDYRDYEVDLRQSVTRQDIKRTLAAISKMAPADAIKAFNNCDQITDMLIYEAAWFQFKVNVFASDDVDLCGETIAKAAAAALAGLPKSEGGQPRKSHHERLARFCRDLWLGCGNPRVANTWEGRPSPMVQFASLLFGLVDDDATDQSTIAERLNDEHGCCRKEKNTPRRVLPKRRLFGGL